MDPKCIHIWARSGIKLFCVPHGVRYEADAREHEAEAAENERRGYGSKVLLKEDYVVVSQRFYLAER